MVEVCKFHLNIRHKTGYNKACLRLYWIITCKRYSNSSKMELEKTHKLVISLSYLSVKACYAGERFSTISCDFDILARLDLADFTWKVNCITFMTSQSQCVCILPVFVAKRDNAHSYQVTAMNSLETFSYHSFDPLLKGKCIIIHQKIYI